MKTAIAMLKWFASIGLIAGAMLASCVDPPGVPCRDRYCPVGYQCTDKGCALLDVCGNEIVEDDEECDDGNDVNNDDCTNACAAATCGDGILWERGTGTEQCDDGNTRSGDGCQYDCNLPTCGDGILDPLEECDCGIDGNPGLECNGTYNAANEGYCSTECSLHCGDGVVAADEYCDGPPADHCTDFGYHFGRLECTASCSGPLFDRCGRANWSLGAAPTLKQLNSIWGADANHVFAVGADGSLVRYDGQSWTLEMGGGGSQVMRAVWGNGPGDIFAVGDGSALWRYDGSIWSPMTAPVPSLQLYSIWGSGLDQVFVVGQDGHIFHFDGVSWFPEKPTTNGLKGVWGSGPDDVFAVGNKGTVCRYNEAMWSCSVPSGLASTTLESVWGSGSDDVFAVGFDNTSSRGRIVHYDGTTWQFQDTDSEGALHSIWGNAPDDVFAVGQDGNIVHYDGTRWSPVPSDTSRHLRGVWGSGPDRVIAVGDLGAIMNFDGTLLTAIESGSTSYLRSIWGTDDGTQAVFIAGHDTVLKASDSAVGPPWIPMSAPAPQCAAQFKLNDLWGTSATDVYAVGESLQIMHYDGTDWSDIGNTAGIPCTGNQVLWSIWGDGQGEVISVGQGGRIFHYNGNTWTNRQDDIPGDTRNLYEVWGIGPGDVYAAGQSGKLIHYDGASWSAVEGVGVSADLNAIWGASADDIFVVGTGGTILHYDGATWSRLEWPEPVAFTALSGTGPSDIFASGYGASGFVIAHYDGLRWSPISRPLGVPRFDFMSVWAHPNGRRVLFLDNTGDILELSRLAPW